MLGSDYSEESSPLPTRALTLLAKSQLTVTALPIVLPAGVLVLPTGVVVPLTLLPTATGSSHRANILSVLPWFLATHPEITLSSQSSNAVCIRLFHDTFRTHRQYTSNNPLLKLCIGWHAILAHKKPLARRCVGLLEYSSPTVADKIPSLLREFPLPNWGITSAALVETGCTERT